MGLPDRLKALIADQKTTAAAIADLAGVSPPVVTLAMNGEQFEGIKAASVIRIAKALGVRPAYLLLGEEPKSIYSRRVVADEDGMRLFAKMVAAEIKSQPSGPEMTENKVGRPDNGDD